MQQAVHRARQIKPKGLESLSSSELRALEDRVTALLLAWQGRVGFVLSHCEKLLPPLLTPEAIAERERLLERDGPEAWRPEDIRFARQRFSRVRHVTAEPYRECFHGDGGVTITIRQEPRGGYSGGGGEYI